MKRCFSNVGGKFELSNPIYVDEVAEWGVEGMPVVSHELLDHLLHGDHRERLGL